jgi:hypothetical protein
MAKIEILKKQYPDSNFTAQPGTNAASSVIKQEVKPDPLEKQKVLAFEAEMKPAVEILTSWGLKVCFSESLFEEENQFAGSDQARRNS